MEVYFGGLVEFKDKSEADKFIETINYENSIRLLEAALTYGMKNGIYDINEAYTIYKCLAKIKEKNEEK